MSAAEWSAQPKMERARLLAFVALRGEVEEYMAYEKEATEIGIELADWLELSYPVRAMHVEGFEKARAIGA